MHQSLINNVKFYLDENEYLSSESYLLRGWVFHESSIIESIRILDNSKTEIKATVKHQIPRVDVSEYYTNFSELAHDSGFELTFKSSTDESVNFEVKINGKWVLCKTVPLMANRIILDKPISGINSTNHPSILAIDDFYTDPIAVREMALGLNFNPSGNHKGKRTAAKYIVEGTREKIEQILGKKIHNWSSQPYNGVFQYCTPADPVVYHYDSQRYAGVVFLTPNAPPESGTSFFRHKKETWLMKDPAEYNMWKNNSHLELFKELVMGTEHDDFLDRTKWEEIDRIGNKFNRFAMWDAKLIHSATSYFGKSKDNGRLFHMFFFDTY